MEYEDGEMEITQQLLEYWYEGRVGQDSVKLSDDGISVEIIWHAA